MRLKERVAEETRSVRPHARCVTLSSSVRDLNPTVATTHPRRRTHPHLRDHLAAINDPRAPRGRRYSPPALLALCVCALTSAGHDSTCAPIAWAHNAPERVLLALGLPPRPFTKQIHIPDEHTRRNLLTRLDPAQPTRADLAYLNTHTPPEGDPARTPAGAPEREHRRAHHQQRHRPPTGCPATPLMPLAARPGAGPAPGRAKARPRQGRPRGGLRRHRSGRPPGLTCGVGQPCPWPPDGEEPGALRAGRGFRRGGPPRPHRSCWGFDGYRPQGADHCCVEEPCVRPQSPHRSGPGPRTPRHHPRPARMGLPRESSGILCPRPCRRAHPESRTTSHALRSRHLPCLCVGPTPTGPNAACDSHPPHGRGGRRSRHTPALPCPRPWSPSLHEATVVLPSAPGHCPTAAGPPCGGLFAPPPGAGSNAKVENDFRFQPWRLSSGHPAAEHGDRTTPPPLRACIRSSGGTDP
ncbi:transposase family protein [Nocardiopsis sp. CNT312]|uniref:transposase family protein n=1 Tax=Nocardiopsis sp. CNT312 TaxID=1137268 RepID=UPI0009DEE783